MPRPRLTPEEREARRKARSAFTFSNAAYRHYNPEVEGYGNPDQWENIAELLFGKAVIVGVKAKFLAVLGLTEMPSTVDELKTAFHAAMFTAHPDRGGTNEAARNVLEAYMMLKRELS